MPPQPDQFREAFEHHQRGRFAEAHALYRRVLDADPRHADALHLLGVLHHQQGRSDLALDRLRRAVAIDPAQPTFRNNLGVVLRAIGQLDDAIAAYREATRLAPGYADALANLGVAFHESGRPAEALPQFEAALRADPTHADALYNLANLLHARGQAAEAIPFYTRAHHAAPGRADVLNNLGNALLVVERADEAFDAHRRATEVEPNHAEAWVNLGMALSARDLTPEAADAFAAAAKLRPHEPHWPIRIAALCPAVFPDNAAIDRYRIGLDAVLDAHRAGVRLAPETAVASGCHPSFNLAHQGRDDRALKAKFAALFRDTFPTPSRRPSPVEGPRTIGFVATSGREGGFLRGTAGIVQRLDPERFRVVVFAPSRSLAAMRAAIHRPDAAFVALPDTFPDAVAAIVAARCDVLYHWQVGTDAFNYFLPFARAAPVQCTSWGSHVTTGILAMDDYLSSALIEPVHGDTSYTETLMRLATLPTFQAPIPRPDPPARRHEFGLPDGRTLYACLQRTQKFHPDFDPILADILRRDPRGLLVLLADRHGHSAAKLADRFRNTMPDVVDRISLQAPQSGPSYLRLLSLADVVLDPIHYGSGLTCYDILGLGLPLVTLPGARHIARYAAGCYAKMGVDDLIAETPEDYANLAVRLGADRGARAEISGRIAGAGRALFEDVEAIREHERYFERAAARARDSG